MIEEMQDSNSFLDQQSKGTNDLENFNTDLPSFVQSNNQEEEYRSNPSQEDNIEVEPARIEEISEEDKFYADKEIN